MLVGGARGVLDGESGDIRYERTHARGGKQRMTTLKQVTEIRHDHVTREVKPLGAGCPACDAYHLRHQMLDGIEEQR